MKYIHKETKAVVEATQWFKNGQHPLDNSRPLPPEEGDEELEYTEGKIVGRFNDPEFGGENLCEKCGRNFREHGFVDYDRNAGDSDGRVCPGDFIVTVVSDPDSYKVQIVSKEDFFSEFEPSPSEMINASTEETIRSGESMRMLAEQNLELGKKEFSDLHPSSYDTLMALYKMMNGGKLPRKVDTMNAIKQAHGYIQGVLSEEKSR